MGAVIIALISKNKRKWRNKFLLIREKNIRENIIISQVPKDKYSLENLLIVLYTKPTISNEHVET